MGITRRGLLTAAGAAPLSRLATAGEAPPRSLPDKSSFAPMDVAYLDAGSQHPISLGAKAAAEAYLAKRSLDPAGAAYDVDTNSPLEKFARLVNADRSEITYVQSTTAGEQMVLKAVGVPECGGHIVTDTLHFFGSLPLYEELARQGMEVTWLRERDGRIPLEDMRRAVRPGTKLVALSLVSTINGFQHDLKTVCDIAHAAGAVVYADIIHAAGAVPVDLRDSGVDFAACASYKWLMGDFGLGFLYVRKGVQADLKRAHYGYYGLSSFQSHIYPLDPPGETIVDYGFRDDAAGHFALGTHSHVAPAMLDYSLAYILELGVENIQAHARPLIDRLKEEIPRRGYTMMTPADSATPMAAFVQADARRTLRPHFDKANVRVTAMGNRFRPSVSVFNDMEDIERLLAALPRAS